MATLDLLGEEVRSADRRMAAVEEYVRLFEAIEARALDANVSIKLTMLGLKIDQAFCRDNVAMIADCARATATSCASTWRIAPAPTRRSRSTTAAAEYRQPGRRAFRPTCVAPWTTSPRCRANGPTSRLCKGIYIEPRPTAWKGYETVRPTSSGRWRSSSTGSLRRYRHPRRVSGLRRGRVARPYEVPRDRYEFQMLLGVDEELRQHPHRRGPSSAGLRSLRRDWYKYSVRRLRENPEVAGHVARAFFGMRKAG